MNCLKFENKQSFMDFVQSLSDEEIILQRKFISNLLETIKYDYNMFRSNLYSTFIFKANKVLSLNDKSSFCYAFKKILKNTFTYCRGTLDSLNKYESLDDSSYEDYCEFDSKESIKDINDNYDLIKSDENGYLNKLESLSTMVMNISAVMLYKLYNVAFVNKDYLEKLSSSPKVIFGGFDNNNQPDYEYTLKKYVERIISSIDFVEGNVL